MNALLLIILLGAFVGHLALTVTIINVLYGQAWPRWLLRCARALHDVWLVFGTPWLVWMCYQSGWSGDVKLLIQKIGEQIQPSDDTHSPGPRRPRNPLLVGRRILLVDNDERVRQAAHTLLGRYGCVIETASEGQEAITMARLSQYDVFIADIRLPDMGGYEIFSGLREVQSSAAKPPRFGPSTLRIRSEVVSQKKTCSSSRFTPVTLRSHCTPWNSCRRRN